MQGMRVNVYEEISEGAQQKGSRKRAQERMAKGLLQKDEIEMCSACQKAMGNYVRQAKAVSL